MKLKNFFNMDYKKIYNQNYFSGKDSFFYKLGYGRFAKFYFNNLFKPLKPHIQKIGRGKILDVGCAYGFMLRKFPDTFEKFGVDISDYAIMEAHKRLPGAALIVGNAEDGLPFPEGFFDIVVCNDVLEHLADPASALKNIRKVLNNNGILYINTPNLNWFRRKVFACADKKEHHFSLFSHETLFDLLTKCGFEILNRWTYTNLTYFFFLKFKSTLGIESAFICRKS